MRTKLNVWLKYSIILQIICIYSEIFSFWKRFIDSLLCNAVHSEWISMSWSANSQRMNDVITVFNGSHLLQIDMPLNYIETPLQVVLTKISGLELFYRNIHWETSVFAYTEKKLSSSKLSLTFHLQKTIRTRWKMPITKNHERLTWIKWLFKWFVTVTSAYLKAESKSVKCYSVCIRNTQVKILGHKYLLVCLLVTIYITCPIH